MANYGMRELGDTHGYGQRIVTMERPYGEALGFGKKIEAGVSGAEIHRATGTDWEVEKVPAYIDNQKRIPGTFAVVRRDTGKPFGNGRCVGANYTPF